MNHDEFLARITGAVSVETPLLRDLCALPEVNDATAQWFHGHIQIRVVLDRWTWDAMTSACPLIDQFGRDHVQHFSVTTEFVPPELQPPDYQT